MADFILDPNGQPTAPRASTPSLDLGPATPQPGAPSAPCAASDGLIKNGDTKSFMVDVIEASMTQPVIVDFWAAWCGPCKTLGPMLEKLVMRAGGLVKMVKIDIDANQALAQQLQIKSVPTVYAFKDGQPVDAFAGALPESQIQSFIDKLIGDAKPPIEAAMEQAEALLSDNQGGDAEAMFGAILESDETYIPALGGMLRAIAQQGEFDRAHDIIAALDAKTRISPDIERAISALELAQQSANVDGEAVSALEARIAANAKDFDARLELAQTFVALQRYGHAIDQLLEIVRLDRNWNDQAGRKQLIKVFDVLGGADPRTQDGRRRLSAVLFS